MPQAKRRRRDPILNEFDTKDLGDDIARSKAGVWIRPKLATSILLSPAIVAKLKQKGEKRGIGYQTMLKIIVHEHVDDY